jgi:hypothetical protein
MEEAVVRRTIARALSPPFFIQDVGMMCHNECVLESGGEENGRLLALVHHIFRGETHDIELSPRFDALFDHE